jgi:probable rRNA maturation factor
MNRRVLAPVDPEADRRLRERLEVTVLDEQTDFVIDPTRWMELCVNVLVDEQVGVGGECGVEVSLLFVDEPSISALNQQFMGKEGPTDVLSFPIDDDAGTQRSGPGPLSFDDDGFPTLNEADDSDRYAHGGSAGHRGRDTRFDADPDPDEMPLLLGDLVVCPTYAARTAPTRVSENHDGSFDDEIALLLVHGILHLLGFDHMNDADAEEMEAREQVHLAKHHRKDRTLGVSSDSGSGPNEASKRDSK